MTINKHFQANIANYTHLLAEWRIKYFREFPYLYEGSFAYEQDYLAGYVTGKDAMLLTVSDNNEIVAIATSIAILGEADIIAHANEHLKDKVDLEKCAYLGEVIIAESHRGKGLSRKIFSTQEEYYKSLGYTSVCFLTVIREENHPLKPANYLDPAVYWTANGYTKTNIISTFDWPTIQADGSVIEQQNEMVYWLKEI